MGGIMAAVSPKDLFEGYEFLAVGEAAPTTGVFIPFSSLGNLDVVDADENDGDGRKVVFAIAREVFEQFTLLGFRPAGMFVERTTPIGIPEPSQNTIRQTYRFAFDFRLDFSDHKFDLIAQ